MAKTNARRRGSWLGLLNAVVAVALMAMVMCQLQGVRAEDTDTSATDNTTDTVCGNDTSCSSHGVCNVTSGNCTCNPGYSGDTCQNAVCLNTSCANGGACNDTGGNITCDCVDGWTGDNCTRADCLNDTCSNNGVCDDSSGQINCTCTTGWRGDICQFAECQNDSCANNGTCDDSSGAINCTCLAGYGGNNCQLAKCEDDSCTDDKHGTCDASSGQINCTCKEGWTEDRCNKDVDECSQGLCLNSDFCENRTPPERYNCTCKTGWKGDDCSEDVDECNITSNCPDPNSDCQNNNGSFTCPCKPGYERVTPDSNCTEIVILAYNLSSPTELSGDDEVFGPYQVDLGFMVNRQIVTQYYVSVNGYITFNTNFSSPTMPDVSSAKLSPLLFIAPYWADTDVRGSSNSSLLHLPLKLSDTFGDNATKDSFQYYKTQAAFGDDFHPVFISVVTWVHVLPYKASEFKHFQPATFQVVLASDGYQLKARLAWRSVWPSSNDLRVAAAYNLDFTTVEALSLADIPQKKIITTSQTLTAPTNASAVCVEWLKTQGKELLPGPAAIACPCSVTQAEEDLVFNVEETEGVKCATSKVDDHRGFKQLCCYGSQDGMLTGDSSTAKPPILKNDVDGEVNKGFEQCRKSPVTLAMYRQKYPVNTCANYTVPLLGLLWGDPHIMTLDGGSSYSFNGLGEYVILRTPQEASRPLEIQGRTKKLENFNLTVFSEFAIQYNGSVGLQVKHTGDKVLKVLNSTGAEVDSATVNSMAPGSLHVSVASDNSELSLVLQSTVTIKITAGTDRLSLTLSAPLDALKDSKGLLGTVNGNPNDDFELKDNTKWQLSEMTSQRFFEFGQSWLVTEDDKLFSTNLTNSTGFTPALLYHTVDELLADLNQTNRLDQGQNLCGTNVACLQDFLVLNDTTTAQQTKDFQEKAEGVHAVLSQKPPVFSEQPPVWNISLTSGVFRYNITVDAEVSNQTLFPSVQNDSSQLQPSDFPLNVTFDMKDPGIYEFVWTLDDEVRSLSAFKLSFTAKSSITNMTSVYSPIIVLCACPMQDQCNYDVSSGIIANSLEIHTVSFLMADCSCEADSGGRFCQDSVDVCEQCFNSSACNATGAGCAACPPGYHGDGIKCYETDECRNEEDNCTQECVNTPGSYNCSCQSGYRIVDTYNCQDINECDEQLHNCLDGQFCSNTEGSYVCECRPGRDGDKCQTVADYRYGGKMVFLAIENKGQGWSNDLTIKHSQRFNELASKVENTVLGVLNSSSELRDKIVKVTVVQFVLLVSTPGSRRRRDTSATQDSMIQATYEVSSSTKLNGTEVNKQLDLGYSPACTSELCTLGSGDNELLGVDRRQSGVDANYDLCRDDRNNLCHDVSTNCSTEGGKASCVCKTGYHPWSLDNNVCQDIDECSLNTTEALCGLDTNGTECVNTAGSYVCSCPRTHGWKVDAMKCVELVLPDTCSQKKPCHENAECVNTGDKTGYACRCKDGYAGPTCSDEEGENMKTVAIGLGAGLGAFCLILLIIVCVMCLMKSRSKKRQNLESMYNVSGTIPRPTLKMNLEDPNSKDMRRQESLHEYTSFRRHEPPLDYDDPNGARTQQYDNPAYTRGEEVSDRL